MGTTGKQVLLHRARSYSPNFLSGENELQKAANKRRHRQSNNNNNIVDANGNRYSWDDASKNPTRKVKVLAEVHGNKKDAKNFLGNDAKKKPDNFRSRNVKAEDVEAVAPQTDVFDGDIFSSSLGSKVRTTLLPLVKCQCNGMEGVALLSSAAIVSTINRDFVRKIRMVNDIVTDIEPVSNPCNVPLPALIGQLRFIQLILGKYSTIIQLYVVQNSASDIMLGMDFLSKSQSVVSFNDNCLVVGGMQGDRVAFLTAGEVEHFKKPAATISFLQ